MREEIKRFVYFSFPLVEDREEGSPEDKLLPPPLDIPKFGGDTSEYTKGKSER